MEFEGLEEKKLVDNESKKVVFFDIIKSNNGTLFVTLPKKMLKTKEGLHKDANVRVTVEAVQ